MADRTRKEIVEDLWNKSSHHRGRRLAAWAKSADGKKEEAKRWEAIQLFAHQHGATAAERHDISRWRRFHGLWKWSRNVAQRIRRAIRRRRHRNQASAGLDGVDVVPSAGDPHWGGGRDVMDQFVVPFMAKYGLWPGSRKRTPAYNQSIGGSPTSDHLTTHTTTDACDFPTYSGVSAAMALAAQLGNPNWQPNSYASWNKVIDGHSFRIQILFGAAIGHDDHIHVGIGLA